MGLVTSLGLLALAQVAASGEGAQADAAIAQSAAADVPRLEISGYDVTGNTLLTTDEIERTVYPYLGPGRTSADVEAARGALEKFYHGKGYQSVVVQVPEQSATSGYILLAVTEVRVANVTVSGVSPQQGEAIKKELGSLAAGTVPNISLAEKQLQSANRFPERQITLLVPPGKEPGTIDVELEVERKSPLHATLQLTNDYASGTRPLRLLGSLRDSNLWGLGHQVTATYLVAPQNRRNLEVFSGSYLAPLGSGTWSALLYGYKSNSNIAALGGTNVLGDGYVIGARAILNLPSAEPKLYHSVNFGADYKNFDESIAISGIDGTVDTPLEYVALGGSYTMGFLGDRDTINATLSVTAGVRGLTRETVEIAGIPTPIFGNKRGSFDAKANFVHFNYDADYTHAFASDIVIFTRMSAQVADGPLVSNEQFAAGGLDTVRGYLQSQAVGDYGLVGAVELRSPSFGKALTSLFEEWRVFGFTDGAYIRTIDPGEGVKRRYKLWSAGLGTRFKLFGVVSGEAVMGFPIGERLRGDGPYGTFSIKADY